MTRWMPLAASLFAVVLVAVTLGVPWASEKEDGSTTQWLPFVATSDFLGTKVSFDWDSDAFDEQDGAGLLRASGPLLATGLALAVLAALAAENLFIGFEPARWVGPSAMALATLFVLLTVVLLPIGIAINHAWDVDHGFSNGGDFVWHAGLYLGILSTLVCAGAAGIGFLHARE